MEPQGISPLQGPSRATPIPFLALQTSVSQDAEDDQLLTGLFLTTMSQRCEKPHDRVFGVLGLTEAKAEIRALGLEGRHDLAERYTVFMGYVLERGRRLKEHTSHRFLSELFSYACLPNKIPSWCPDLPV